MELDSVACSECGATDWTQILSTDYPERRKGRERTMKEVYRCENCGAEGRRFDQKNSGTTRLSGAMR